MKEDQPEICEHLLVLQEGRPPIRSVFLQNKIRLWTLSAALILVYLQQLCRSSDEAGPSCVSHRCALSTTC